MNTKTQEFQAIGPVLDVMVLDPQARVFYDLLADALVWADEIPSLEKLAPLGVSYGCLRGIWHYRSSLIVGVPSEKHRPSWELGLGIFPNWPGFDPKRRNACHADTCKALKEAGMDKWIADEAKLDDKVTHKASTATV